MQSRLFSHPSTGMTRFQCIPDFTAPLKFIISGGAVAPDFIPFSPPARAPQAP